MKTRTFHLSVAHDGVVSLWDSASQAKNVNGEIYVPLELTPVQEATIQAATRRAAMNRRMSDESYLGFQIDILKMPRRRK